MELKKGLMTELMNIKGVANGSLHGTIDPQ